MNLESNGLSAPSNGDAPHNDNASPGGGQDDSSVRSNGLDEDKRDTKPQNSRKRKRAGDVSTVEIFNVPWSNDCEKLKEFVGKMALEMHGKKIEIMLCQYKESRAYRGRYFVSSESPDFVEIAISLNGVQCLNRPIYVGVPRPSRPPGTAKNLCLCLWSYFGACDGGCYNAHGVLDLKLYRETALSEDRTIYVKNIPFNYPPEHFLNAVRKRFHNHGICPFFTAFHARAKKGDALVEFADIRHAKKAHEILSDIRFITGNIEVLPWKQEMQSFFVDYFRKLEAEEKHSAEEWEDDKRELRRLRDEVYKLKYNQKKFADLERENHDYKGQLNETHDDVRYYRDKYDREKSDVRRLEDKVDDLRRENDDLVRENDDLRNRHHGSSPSGGYRDVDKSLQDELRYTRLKYEESKDRVYDLKSELDKTLEEKEVLVRDSKRLKSSVDRLEANSNTVKKENEEVSQHQDELQRQLDAALAKIADLNGVVTTTQMQLKGMKSEKDSMNEAVANLEVENETLQEEMEQMRMNHALELGFAGAEDA